MRGFEHVCCRLLTFFQTFSKRSFRNAIRLSNGLDPDQDQIRLKPVCSATENSLITEILHVAGLAIILITKVLIRLHGCPGWPHAIK